ncbi:hypothetical protein NDI76_03565 [Halogeometricum sp. S1BR25-6]|uniref:Uncharacterized protein n=1 Tax=Halogeometricum salsisoli TaxID=2950536 RepID=A0ABU2GAI8_9EURY|nr:hypothetical protein [Halogeometricum sp. S1BR25-6]MDS0297810.1 hypothetical protein [Halogeometricum sp. S1BR25-6]
MRFLRFGAAAPRRTEARVRGDRQVGADDALTSAEMVFRARSSVGFPSATPGVGAPAWSTVRRGASFLARRVELYPSKIGSCPSLADSPHGRAEWVEPGLEGCGGTLTLPVGVGAVTESPLLGVAAACCLLFAVGVIYPFAAFTAESG